MLFVLVLLSILSFVSDASALRSAENAGAENEGQKVKGWNLFYTKIAGVENEQIYGHFCI